mmetsp:Transcript_20326/g.52029  ORF Transcript_20326/g.52029 Transcript_20326/m.52029 type:complete len:651 (-) Transcript_20326:36-1988(-)
MAPACGRASCVRAGQPRDSRRPLAGAAMPLRSCTRLLRRAAMLPRATAATAAATASPDPLHALRWPRLTAAQRCLGSPLPRNHARLVTACAAPGQELAASSGPSLVVEDVLSHMRQAMGADSSNPLTDEVIVRGTGNHLGNDIGWQVCLRPDGAFVEEIVGSHMSFCWGHNGSRDANCWEKDDYGVSRVLELDDHESLLLAAWVRSCFWLHAARAGLLEVSLLPEPGTAEAAGGNGAHTEGGSSSSVTLGLRLLEGKMVARLKVCTTSWQPLQMVQPLCGDTEAWRYVGWAELAGGLTHPREVVHQGAAGGQHSYMTVSAELRSAALSAAAALSYSIPADPLCPTDTAFIPGLPPAVKAWYTRSGHVLVQPRINGIEAGYMILDTGASGFVIEKAAADKLGLLAFGELYVSGMAGKIRCQFRRADNIEIGPLVMQRPLFMEMMLGGLVRGAPGPVVGIVGYEIFRRAVVELPVHSQGDGEYELKLHNPETYQPEPKVDECWQDILMVANLPHVEVNFSQRRGAPQAARHSKLFMLDSGAGGADAMFHTRAAAELGLVDDNSTNFRYIKGVGGEDMSVRVQYGELEWMTLSSHRLERIRCLFGGSGGLDLSLYTAGIICSDLMSRMHVVVDYARRRIAFLPPKRRGFLGGK